MKAKLAAEEIMVPENVGQYGLRFLMSQIQRIGLNEDLIRVILEAVAKIHYSQPTELVEVPAEVEGEDNERLREEAQTKNEDIEKNNAQLLRMQSFVKLVVPLEGEPEMDDFSDKNELAFLRLSNFLAQAPAKQTKPEPTSAEKEAAAAIEGGEEENAENRS